MAIYEVQTEDGTYEVETEEPAQWSDVPGNIVKDVKGGLEGMAEMGKTALDPTGLGRAVMAQDTQPIVDAALTPYNQVKGMVSQIGDIISDPVGTFKEHPLNTSLLAAPLVKPLMGSKPIMPKAAPLIEEPALPKADQTGFAENLKSKIPSEITDPMKAVNNYLQQEYREASSKPGMADIASSYLKEHSRNMNLKELGAAPGQVRKIGVERAHELADYANQNGLVGPKIGTQGREKLIVKRLEDAGGAVGAFRKIASDRGAVQDINNLTNQIKSKLDQKYLKAGIYSGQKGAYAKALEELKKTDGTAQALSDKVTEMFKEAKNQNPLGKPTGPLADVAREVRAINHESIKQSLKPEEMVAYENALEDYGALTQLNEFVKRRSSTEAGGRLGPGAGISRAAVQKFLDSFGYRAEAKIANNLADWIKKNPDALKRPKEIFRQYIDEAADAIHETGEAVQ